MFVIVCPKGLRAEGKLISKGEDEGKNVDSRTIHMQHIPTRKKNKNGQTDIETVLTNLIVVGIIPLSLLY